ncbi:TetR/AcrR family transcriptional regulator [Aliikangiella coralliicola]|uniref:TetR/AcrR family transcriptional regulator n=1 Tax=Aliikangiella coralliicola TaxID=2592383 RepID=A0A545UJU5_9GAMM|nr:TetR/AcrR family transcriptional regulator [Aliikangiella coralliicola]TQV89730.1 TetR/AcrR family transcriptional regulator [Aliikangiella coralliicola]
MSPRTISESEFTQREQELIEIARSLVEKECLTTLTIDKLVSASPYSKGTIYKHFISKEDLLMAICNTCIQEVQELFVRALKFKGNSRERIQSVMVSYILWAKLHPSELFAVLSAHSPSVAACSSDDRNETHHECESNLMGIMNVEIGKAIDAGDLVLPEDMAFEQVTFAMWSASWGAMALIMSKGHSEKLRPMVLERESLTNARLVLDGFNWKPLSKDWDYSETIKRITQEIFQPEIEQLEKNGTPFIFI